MYLNFIDKHKNIVHVELKLTEEFKTTADELYATLTRPEVCLCFIYNDSNTFTKYFAKSRLNGLKVNVLTQAYR